MTRKSYERPAVEVVAAEFDAVEAVALLEPTEPPLQPTGWPITPTGARRVRGRASLSTEAWFDYLFAKGVVRETPPARVPRWVNDLAGLVSAYAGSPSAPDVVRLVKRAVRSAQSAPLFRSALAARTQHLRGGATPAASLLAWLRDRDWSDARPGAALGAQDVGRDGAECADRHGK